MFMNFEECLVEVYIVCKMFVDKIKCVDKYNFCILIFMMNFIECGLMCNMFIIF